MVIGGDDGLTVAIGGEDGAVALGELGPQLQVVVDLAVEHQLVPVWAFRWPPTQRLMRVGDIDDGQPVETEHDGPGRVGPGARLVGSAVAHQMRCAGDRLGRFEGPGRRTRSITAGRSAHEGQQSTHRDKYAATRWHRRRRRSRASPRAGPGRGDSGSAWLRRVVYAA